MRWISSACCLLVLLGCEADESSFQDPPPEPEPGPGADAQPEPAPSAEPEPEAPTGPHGIDSFEWTCADPAWTPGACAAGVGERHDSRGASHVPEDEPIRYDLSPPSADNHRGQWARWGEYRSLPPQRWLHNLEHGGVALLYHPCAPAEMVDELRSIAQGRGDDFRWILTPYADLPGAVAVVAWEWRYLAECVNAAEIEQFIDQHYGMAPEDVGAHGGYDIEWVGD